MAEETTTAQPETAAPAAEESKAPEAPEEKTPEEKAAATASSGENGAKEGSSGGEGKGGRKQREETAIEELFDLSKPIPRVPRPSKEEHEVDLAKITTDIDALKEQRRKIQSKIDSTMNSNRNSAAGAQKEVLSKLRAKKGALIDEKRAIRARLDEAKSKTEKLSQQRKDTKSSIRFTSVADIDREIAILQKRQETTSMSLAAEKQLIKEMDQLQASKKLVEDLKSKEAGLEGAHQARKAIGAEIAAKDKEIDAVQKEIDEKQAILRATQEKDSGSRDELKALFAERDGLKKKMDEKFGERNECRQKFRDANNTWYDHQRAVRAQKRIQYEEERKRREEEKAAWLKKKEEEEAKKIPYEEEMALCDYLAEYLTRTHLTDPEDQKKKQQEELEKKKKADVVAVKDDPFAGFKPVKKKSDDVFLKMGKGKKKRDRSSAKKKKEEAVTFTLSVDSFEQFGLINLTPPTSLDQVEKSVEDLRAKKKWYSGQPRGSVQTAQDIRKAREKAAQKFRQNAGGDGDGGTKKKGSGSKGFKVSSDDFAPLGSGGGSSSLNASWGQKPAEEAEGDAEPASEDKDEGGDASMEESS